MGYSEVLCSICGVSFNICRFRAPGEPPEAAWFNDGTEVRPFIDVVDDIGDWSYGMEWPCVEEGCYFVRRSDKKPADESEKDDSESEGNHASSGHNVDDEPQDDEDDGDEWRGVFKDGCCYDHSYDEHVSDTPEEQWERWPQPLSECPVPSSPPAGYEDMGEYFEASGCWEHVSATRDCYAHQGYHGIAISVEAMRGCNTAQCLVPKPTNDWERWEPRADDEPFEIEGDYFLSGLTDHMRDRDDEYPLVFPPRHNCNEPDADNYNHHNRSLSTLAMAFHPTCLEVFKRASMYRSGVVDIKGLTGWFRLEANHDAFYSFPRHSDVKEGWHSRWHHQTGSEYLVANPCFVPELGPILSKAKSGSHSDATSAKANIAETVPSASEDVLSGLPYDIRLSIALHLTLEDLASLRQVTLAFEGFPQSMYHALMRDTTPWLYETWCSMPISRWATTTAKQLRKGEKPESVLMEPLDPAATDYVALASELARAGKTALGLQNRRRIWKDCEEILRRVDAYREKGQIGPREEAV